MRHRKTSLEHQPKLLARSSEVLVFRFFDAAMVALMFWFAHLLRVMHTLSAQVSTSLFLKETTLSPKSR
jgi:hypothetical protein